MKKSYLQQLRQHIGHRKVIHPAARIVIENEQGEYLFIKRGDNLKWGIPSGGLEENETIEECIRREVLEETGLTIKDLVVTGIGSEPKLETVTYPNNDVVQYLTINFYSKNWIGEWQPDGKESLEVQFFSMENMPPIHGNEKNAFESLAFFKKNKTILLT